MIKAKQSTIRYYMEYKKEENLLISTIITAFVSFMSTNIDDIFVLMLFSTQINEVIKRRHIVIGQYLGIGVLTTISIIGALGISVIPHEYVGLLGLVPIYLGIKEYKPNSYTLSFLIKMIRV